MALWALFSLLVAVVSAEDPIPPPESIGLATPCPVQAANGLECARQKTFDFLANFENDKVKQALVSNVIEEAFESAGCIPPDFDANPLDDLPTSVKIVGKLIIDQFLRSPEAMKTCLRKGLTAKLLKDFLAPCMKEEVGLEDFSAISWRNTPFLIFEPPLPTDSKLLEGFIVRVAAVAKAFRQCTEEKPEGIPEDLAKFQEATLLAKELLGEEDFVCQAKKDCASKILLGEECAKEIEETYKPGLCACGDKLKGQLAERIEAIKEAEEITIDTFLTLAGGAEELTALANIVKGCAEENSAQLPGTITDLFLPPLAPPPPPPAEGEELPPPPPPIEAAINKLLAKLKLKGERAKQVINVVSDLGEALQANVLPICTAQCPTVEESLP